jgi:hypothetical protein
MSEELATKLASVLWVDVELRVERVFGVVEFMEGVAKAARSDRQYEPEELSQHRNK